jgi:hypothetical protein
MGSHRVGHDWSDLAAAAVVIKNIENFQEGTPQAQIVSLENSTKHLKKKISISSTKSFSETTRGESITQLILWG